MQFEFGSAKSESNKLKHGVDFVEIQALWDGFKVEVPAKSEGELRYAVIGLFNGATYVVIITYRGVATRVISAHRANEKETKHYEEETQK